MLLLVGGFFSFPIYAWKGGGGGTVVVLHAKGVVSGGSIRVGSEGSVWRGAAAATCASA